MKINIGIKLIIICLAFSSCTKYYFSNPQPIDSKNMYSIPKKYVGSWQLATNTVDNVSSLDSLVIGKNYYKYITKSKLKESKSVMELDSNIYFLNDKIYTNMDGSLEGGYNYVIKDDTVIIDAIDIELIEFGENAFIRKFNYGYILNIKHKKMNDWWHIKFIDTRNKEGIVIRELAEEDLEKINNLDILHEDFSNYLNANWSKVEIEDLINNGGFSDTTLFLKYDEKIKN